MIKDIGMKLIKSLGMRLREIAVVAIIICVIYFPFKLFSDYKMEEYIANSYDNMDAFTAEDEEIMQELFNITLIDNMELVWARFISMRDPAIMVWYSVRGDVNNLLELNPHYVLHDSNTSIADYRSFQSDNNDNTHEKGPRYYWEEGANYMVIYEENDYHVVVFFTKEHTKEHQEDIWDIREQVFLKEQDE